MKKKVDVIVQARSGSTRLDSKVLLSLTKNNFCSIDLIYKRLSLSKYIDRIVFSIPRGDIKLKKYLKDNNYQFYEGSKENVLDRFYKTALHFKFKNIARITADCPLVCPKNFDELSNFFF